MKYIVCLLALLCASSAYAGPHTIQKGETFADVAKLYNVPLDSILKANPNTEAYVGLTIDVPISALFYDLGNSDLFRNIRYRYTLNHKKGVNKYETAHNKQLKLNQFSGKKRQKIEAQIVDEYTEAVTYGNIDALYQLGCAQVHGVIYGSDDFPSFDRPVNGNLDEFQKGIEYLQIAALVGNNSKALVEMALACVYEDSPIRNPYLCLGMLEQIQKEHRTDVNHLICYMFENGYGIRPDLLQAYIYCPAAELTSESGVKTHRERILEQIESMPANFESSRYGVGLDSKTLLSIGLSHYHNDIIDPEGIFWLHRSARLDNADANWALASILHNGKHNNASIGNSKDSQILCFVKKAAANGKQEAKEYLEAYEKQQKAKAQQARYRALEHQRQIEEKKQRRRQMWANIAGTVIQTAAQTFVAVESAKMQSYQMQGATPNLMQEMPIGQMSDAQWQARNQLALQQIAQYTINKTYADWTGTPMIPTDMSAVDLGTDMSPGSPLWNWGMQQQINTMATQNARMGCEITAFYRRQADQITQQLIENPFQPIAGYVDGDGNWISYEMVAAGNNSSDNVYESSRYSSHEDIRAKNKAYYAERYGNKECHLCHGSGVCSTCNGHGYSDNKFGVQGVHECPNCLRVNGHASGKCSTCQGSGQVYGLK